jgi:hypothetical protein
MLDQELRSEWFFAMSFDAHKLLDREDRRAEIGCSFHLYVFNSSGEFNGRL